MITYSETKENLLDCICNNINEMVNIKTLYKNKLNVFEEYTINLNEKIQNEKEIKEISIFVKLLLEVIDNIKRFKKQIKKIERCMLVLSNIKNDIDKINENSYRQRIERYNKSYNRLKKEMIDYSIAEEQLTLACIEKNIFSGTLTKNSNDKNTEVKERKFDDENIKDNNTLLISEIQNKVIFPYRVSELREILLRNENEYSDLQTIIDEMYTAPLTQYKNASISRFRETYTLMRQKEKVSLFDSLDLALELMINRYVHPAIITACRNLDQLDIYLDCLETNELDDFPFFNIQYELYPMKVKSKKTNFGDATPKKNIWKLLKKTESKKLMAK